MRRQVRARWDFDPLGLAFEKHGAALFPAALDETALGRIERAVDGTGPRRPGARLYDELRAVAGVCYYHCHLTQYGRQLRTHGKYGL